MKKLSLIFVVFISSCGGSSGDKSDNKNPTDSPIVSGQTFAGTYNNYASLLLTTHCTITLTNNLQSNPNKNLKADTTYLKSSLGIYVDGIEAILLGPEVSIDSCVEGETIAEDLILNDFPVYETQDLSGSPICVFKAGEVVNGTSVHELTDGFISTNVKTFRGTESLIEITRWDAMKERCSGKTKGFAKGKTVPQMLTVYKKK